MTNPAVFLDLKEMPNGYGFFYGTAHIGEKRYRIDIMPSVEDAKRLGITISYNDIAEEKRWVIFVDGERKTVVRDFEAAKQFIVDNAHLW
ncbi:hypothetical protein EBR66_04565 [bacterium]|nr:hypothetical protein [bacterium]